MGTEAGCSNWDNNREIGSNNWDRRRSKEWEVSKRVKGAGTSKDCRGLCRDRWGTEEIRRKRNWARRGVWGTSCN